MSERNELLAYLKGIVQNLPETPGCYQYLDDSGRIIYVGKAKNLKRRVSSYFNKEQQTQKTRLLVAHIRDIRYVVVKTEEDALLLENNLIKRYKPHYNVLLKDDKTYPSIAVTKEYLPRIFKTRRRNERGAIYFGPYSHVPTMYALLDLCAALYHPRPCRTPMTEEGVAEGRYKVCLDYHIHRCLAPCTGRQSHADYMRCIEACKDILRGKTAEVANRLREEMAQLAEEMRFEEAQEVKRRYDLVENFRAKSVVVSGVAYDIDVFHIESEERVAYINYLHVTQGCINQAFTFEFRKRLDETEADLLRLGIVEMRTRYGSKAHEVVVPFHVDLPDDMLVQTVPQRGDKKKLLDLARLNVKQYKFDRLKQAEKLNPEQKQTRLMKELQNDLGLEHLPLRIELFDNSHTAGTDAVAACVVFERLKPKKSLYRKYVLNSGSGPDDYASMQEVVRRRYTRLKNEGQPLPDLIIADGGRGQMGVVRQVVHDELGLDIAIAGLAKDDRHRTRALLTGFPPAEVGLKANSQLFRTLTQMQDEVHRFAIKFHREKRAKRITDSELDHTPGVGPATRQKLLAAFKTVRRMKAASADELKQAVGQAKGAQLYALWHAPQAETDAAANALPQAPNASQREQ